MKSRGGKSQRREEKRREEKRREEKRRAEQRRGEKRREEERRSKKRKSQKRESLRRKKIQKKEDPGARKGSKVAKHCVFPMICGSGGSKSSFFTCKCASCHNGVPFFISHLASWLCTRRFSEPRSEHFLKLRCRKSARRCGAKHISMSKCAKHTRSGPLLEVETTFGSWHVEKVHAIVARSTFRSQNAQSTPCSDHFWKLRCRKSARRCGAKHISVQKTVGYGALLDVQICFRVAGARDCGPCQKWAKREGFVAFPKTTAGVGQLKRICKDAFSVAGAVQETCSSELLGGQGADFLRGVAFWSIKSSDIFSFAEMILRDRCSTSIDLASLFRGRRSTLDRWSGKIARNTSALHSTFHFWRKSRRIVSFLMLSTSKIEEVSQNCFVFDVVKFKNWGSLADLFRFWCCQLRKLRKSRRIVSFLMLSTSKIEEVSQNCFVFDVVNWRSLADCFVFDVVKFKNWGGLAE